MWKRAVSWLAVAVMVLTVVALLIPGSPINLTRLFLKGGFHNGHQTRYWIEALDNPDAEARREAIHSLGAIGAEADEAVPALATIMLEDPDRGARIEASLALMKMAPASGRVVPALALALEQKEPFVRMNAAIALGRLGKTARPAIPALIKALNNKDNDTNLGAFTVTIQEMAALDLGSASAGSDEAVPALRAALKLASNERMRRTIARALGAIGPEALPAAPQLRALLAENNHLYVRDAAEEALQRIERAIER